MSRYRSALRPSTHHHGVVYAAVGYDEMGGTCEVVETLSKADLRSIMRSPVHGCVSWDVWKIKRHNGKVVEEKKLKNFSVPEAGKLVTQKRTYGRRKRNYGARR